MNTTRKASFTKILIANRGEIACRVIKTAHRLGYSTVAVYSEADAQARHVELADEAVCIGPAPVSESYLNIDAIIAAAKATGANAVHPGYGFLSENATFAARCDAEDICFIGPPIGAIELMGSKRESKIAMLAANVPCIPGYEGDHQDESFLLKEAQRICLPLMIKASAGGGGRGMRRVDRTEDIQESLQRARSEAENAFGSGELILERAVDSARHVEIQVFGDTHGNYVFLGERDCSMQRRHQKVVEEAPSPAVTPEIRRAMGAAAVKAAQACKYVGAGTVEFLLDQKGEFYFLEMNTRLQVEHPVTEMITGEDLVEWQIRVARGERLPKLQEEITLTGHAIEVRLYAEDPANQFLPQTGDVLVWQPAPEDLARSDHGLKAGVPISRFYDPMLAKIICHGDTREDALRKLERALRQTVLMGVTHNKGFLLDLLATQTFRDGEATTNFIALHYGNEGWHRTDHLEESLTVAALALNEQPFPHAGSTGNLARFPQRTVLLQSGETDYSITSTLTGESNNTGERNNTRVSITTKEATTKEQTTKQFSAQLLRLDNDKLHYRWEGVNKSARIKLVDDQIHVDLGHGPRVFENHTHRPPQSQDGAGSGILKAPMDGAVTAVMVTVGETVSKGQTLLVIEAMKMEHLVRADLDGVVEEIIVQKGQQVKGKQRLGNLKANP
ncbi:Putative biotin carboxylase protein [gamma proteobacterium HdN1]|nr:Putative biotin carboxylase protein [gamma proteobacterium HdN1]